MLSRNCKPSGATARWEVLATGLTSAYGLASQAAVQTGMTQQHTSSRNTRAMALSAAPHPAAATSAGWCCCLVVADREGPRTGGQRVAKARSITIYSRFSCEAAIKSTKFYACYDTVEFGGGDWVAAGAGTIPLWGGFISNCVLALLLLRMCLDELHPCILLFCSRTFNTAHLLLLHICFPAVVFAFLPDKKSQNSH